MRSNTVSRVPRKGVSSQRFHSTLRRRLLIVFAASSLACTFVECRRRGSDAAEQARLDRGRADYQARSYSAAEREFREAVQLQPDNPEAHYRLGITLRELGWSDEAMTELYRAHLVHRDYSDSLVLLAQLMVRSNDIQSVRWSGDHAQRILKKKTDPAMRAEAYYILGLGRIRLNDPQGATDYFNQALKENPGHIGALCLLALQDADRGEIDTGEQRLKAALARDPSSAVLASALAEYCRMARKPAEAEAQWRRVIALDPANAPARINLVDLFCSQGRDDEADEMARSLAQQPDSSYRHWHALLLFRRGRTRDAVSELQEIVRRTPQDQTARVRLIAALVALDQLSEAGASLEESERNGGRSLDYLLMRAQIAVNRMDPEAAKNLVIEATRFDPASGQPHLLAARLPETAANPYRVNYELGQALRLESTLLPARLATVRRQIALRDNATALAALDACPPGQLSTYPVLLQRSWVMLANGEWAQAGKEIDGLAALERSPEIAAQQAVLQSALRNFPAARAASAELVRISQNSPIALELTQLVGSRMPSPDEVKAGAIKLGSQPLWESYKSDLLVLPRGLMRSVLDPEGLLPLQSFGIWEPMINAS